MARFKLVEGAAYFNLFFKSRRILFGETVCHYMGYSMDWFNTDLDYNGNGCRSLPLCVFVLIFFV